MALPILIDAGEAVTLRAVLIALSDLLAWLVVVALAAIIVALVYAILWPLNQLVSGATGGLVGSVPGSHAVEKAVLGAFKSSVGHLDKAVGSFLHACSTILHKVGQEIVGLAILGAYIAWYVSPAHLALLIAQHVSGFVRKLVATESIARTAERDAIRAEKAAKSVAHGVYPRLKAAEHAIDVTIPHELKTTRTLAREAEAEASKAWNAIKAHPWTVVTATFVSAVAVALSRLGLGWLRCPSLNALNNRGKCSVWSSLEGLLGLVATALAVADLEELAEEGLKVEHDVAEGIAELVGLGDYFKSL